MAPKTASEVLLAMDELAPDLAAKKLKARKQLAMEQGEEAVAALEAELEAAQEAEKQAAEVEAGRGDGSEGAGDDAAAEGNEGQGKGGTQADGTHRHPSLEGAAADTLLSMASGAAGSILGHMGFKVRLRLPAWLGHGLSRVCPAGHSGATLDMQSWICRHGLVGIDLRCSV